MFYLVWLGLEDQTMAAITTSWRPQDIATQFLHCVSWHYLAWAWNSPQEMLKMAKHAILYFGNVLSCCKPTPHHYWAYNRTLCKPIPSCSIHSISPVISKIQYLDLSVNNIHPQSYYSEQHIHEQTPVFALYALWSIMGERILFAKSNEISIFLLLVVQ